MELYKRYALVVKEKYKNITEFADSMGVAQAYASKILNGSFGIGMKPIIWLLSHHPDIDARWLITGEGFIYGNEETMINDTIRKVIELEKYICVMNTQEIEQFIDCMKSFDKQFPKHVLERLSKEYEYKYNNREKLIQEAIRKNLILVNAMKSEQQKDDENGQIIEK